MAAWSLCHLREHKSRVGARRALRRNEDNEVARRELDRRAEPERAAPRVGRASKNGGARSPEALRFAPPKRRLVEAPPVRGLLGEW